MRRAGRAAVALAVVGALLFVVGLLNPPRPRGITTDGLGPENGESIDAYVARSNETGLVGLEGPRWALVSFDRAVGIDAVRELSRTVRVSLILFQVPIPRVQTPAVSVAVSASDGALQRAGALAAGAVQTHPAPNERAQAILDVSSARLSHGCACVVGVLVRADPAELDALRSVADVRAVEALDVDVSYGQFAVRPLLPEHETVAVPGPDDGPVPER